MPIYNPYNEVVQPAKYVAPLDLNLLLKGTQYKQEQSEKNFNEIQGQINNVLAIPAYGKDKEVLNQKIQELQQVMSGLNVSELGTPQAKQQINSIINQFSQDKDVQAITNRGYSYEKMIADKKEAEKKGGKYINYGIDDLNNYYSGDNYIRDVKFSNDGYLGADVGKVMEDIKKTMTPTKTTRTLPNGEVITEEQYDNKALLENTKLQLQNTNWEKEIKDRIKRKYANENIDEYALQQASQLESVATQNLNNAYYIYGDPSSTKEQKEKAVADIQKSQEMLSKVNSIKNNPYHGQAFLLSEIDDEKNKSIGKVAEALNYRQESLPKLDEAYKMAEEHKHDFAIKAQESANRQKEELFKQQAELFEGLTKEEQDLVRKQGNFNGVDLSKAYQTIESNKRKNAQAANPNYKITGSDVIDGYTDKEWADNVFVVSGTGTSKKVSIPNTSGAKNLIRNLIIAHPEKFTEIPEEYKKQIIENPDADIIDIVDGDIEIDPNFWNPTAEKYIIKASDALKYKNEIKNPEQSNSIQNTPKEIKLDTGHIIPKDTVEAIRSQLLALGKDTSDASVGIIYKKKFTSK